MAKPITNSPSLLAIERLTVGADRIQAQVRVVDPARHQSNPELIAHLLERHPNLPYHACVNGRGPTFGAVMERTPIPHVLEHLVVDFQTRACPDPDRIFTGASRWLDVHQGLASVEVSYADDLVALRAFRDAAALLNGLG